MLLEHLSRDALIEWLPQALAPGNLFSTYTSRGDMSLDWFLIKLRGLHNEWERKWGSPMRAFYSFERHSDGRLHAHGYGSIQHKGKRTLARTNKRLEAYRERYGVDKMYGVLERATKREHTPHFWLEHEWTLRAGGIARTDVIYRESGVAGYVCKYVMKGADDLKNEYTCEFMV